MFLRPPAPGARPASNPQGGLGLRLRAHLQLPRRLRDVPAPQDRGRGRAAADPHRAGRRLRPARAGRRPRVHRHARRCGAAAAPLPPRAARRHRGRGGRGGGGARLLARSPRDQLDVAAGQLARDSSPLGRRDSLRATRAAGAPRQSAAGSRRRPAVATCRSSARDGDRCVRRVLGSRSRSSTPTSRWPRATRRPRCTTPRHRRRRAGAASTPQRVTAPAAGGTHRRRPSPAPLTRSTAPLDRLGLACCSRSPASA